MAIPRALLAQVRRLDQYELRRLLIVVRGLLIHVDGPPADEAGLPPNLTYRQEAVRCGKASCNSCPHGPYWYAYWKEDGRTRKRYVGRHLSGEPLEPVVPESVLPDPDLVRTDPDLVRTDPDLVRTDPDLVRTDPRPRPRPPVRDERPAPRGQ